MTNSKKSGVITAVLLILCMFFEAALLFFSFPDHIMAAEDTVTSDTSELNSAANNILVWKTSSLSRSSLQEVINTDFSEDPLNGTIQTYVMGIINDPLLTPDLYYYTNALTSALNASSEASADTDASDTLGTSYVSTSSGSSISPASLQKSLITLQMCLEYSASETDIFSCVSAEVLDNAFETSIGARGLMSYIYGLKLLNAVKAVPDNSSFTREELTIYLLSLQLPDGGFSLSGDEGDVDVTAMLLQAVAPEYLSIAYGNTCNNTCDNTEFNTDFSDSEKETVKSCTEKALTFLKNSQLQSGDFGSMGTPCSESTAQVILALVSLDMSPDYFVSDGGNVPTDGLMLYLTEEGGFRHADGLPVNDLASSQAFEALAAILSVSEITKKADAALSSGVDNYTGKKIYVKIIILVILCIIYAAAVILTVILHLKRKKNGKALLFRILSYTIILGILIFITFSIRLQSVNDYKNNESDIIFSVANEDTISVTVSISCETVAEQTGISEIYPSTDIYVKKGATVFEVLKEVCRLNDIQLDYESSSVYGTAYIKGINSLYELDYGDLSGWMYRVDGEFPAVGCGYYILSDGSTVEWLYTTNLGNDLGTGHSEDKYGEDSDND